MKSECIEIRLKPCSVGKVRAWAERLSSDAREYKQLLKAEGIVLESVFLREDSNEAYLIYYLRTHNLAKALEIARASLHPLDVFHRTIMREVTATTQSLECLIDVAIDQ